MDQSNVKRRDVWTFDEFAKSYEQASKSVMLKKGENAHPGAHQITGEGAYVRNDANPYKAFGIPHDAKEANVNDRMNANRVHVFTDPKTRVDVITGGKDIGEQSQAALDTIINTMQSAVIIDESAQYNPEDLEKVIKNEEETE